MDLEDAQIGGKQALVSNTADRVEEVASDIDTMPKARQLSRKDGERLRSRLQFANTHLFGRSTRRSLRDWGKRLTSGKKNGSTNTVGVFKWGKTGVARFMSTYVWMPHSRPVAFQASVVCLLIAVER